MSNKLLIKSVIAVLALSGINSSLAAQITSQTTAQDNSQVSERCYGIVKAGQNDCETAQSSCAGSSKVDGQKDAWVFVPKGLCNKIVGGSLKKS